MHPRGLWGASTSHGVRWGCTIFPRGQIGVHILPIGSDAGARTSHGVRWGCTNFPWGQMGVHNLPMGYLGVHKLPKVRSFTFFLSLTEEYRKGRHTKIYIHEDLCAASRNKRLNSIQKCRSQGRMALLPTSNTPPW